MRRFFDFLVLFLVVTLFAIVYFQGQLVTTLNLEANNMVALIEYLNSQCIMAVPESPFK